MFNPRLKVRIRRCVLFHCSLYDFLFLFNTLSVGGHSLVMFLLHWRQHFQCWALGSHRNIWSALLLHIQMTIIMYFHVIHWLSSKCINVLHMFMHLDLSNRLSHRSEHRSKQLVFLSQPVLFLCDFVKHPGSHL